MALRRGRLIGGWADASVRQIAPGMPLYTLLYVLGIIFFAYFYTAIIFNPDDVSENMRKYGGFVPGIRPGKRTAEYIDTILARITLVGVIERENCKVTAVASAGAHLLQGYYFAKPAFEALPPVVTDDLPRAA